MNENRVASTDIANYLKGESNFEYEEEVKRDPFSVKAWCNYVGYCKEQEILREKKEVNEISEEFYQKIFQVYERALRSIPRSYKLWKSYLDDQHKFLRGRCFYTDEAFKNLHESYEKCLIHLNKMPKIWISYCKFIYQDMKRVTKSRHVFDRALRALPVTQHDRIWSIYLAFIQDINIPEVSVRVYRRYLMFNPNGRDDYVDYLHSIKHYREAAEQLAVIINDEKYVHTKGKTKHQLWMELCDLASQHPEEVSAKLNVDAIIRSGLRSFTDESGRLWCSLATFYIRLGQFEAARDIYEEGIDSVITVRDFSMIFDAYTKFEEELLTAKMTLMDDDDSDEEDDKGDVEMRLARLEYLMDRRPILLNSVLLRQNPHNVREWHKRVSLFKDNPAKVILTFTEAVKTVSPQRAVGRLSSLWIHFAKYYEKHGDHVNATTIFKKAVTVNYKSVDELAIVFCEWAELELRAENFEDALDIIRFAAEEPDRQTTLRQFSGKGPVQDRLFTSQKLWSFLCDLEESLGTVETVRKAYDRSMELRVVSTQMILNYAAYLQEQKYFEDSFRAYERGLSIFGFPQAYDIWLAYLSQFKQRYGGKKLERLRDLYEQVLRTVPSTKASIFYIKYAEMEEEFGLVRHAMSIYDRCTKAVDDEEKFDMYLIYLRKAEKFFGVARTREIYEKGIESLPDKSVPLLCMKFVDMEKKLGEVDRARAILTHCSQFCDPRMWGEFWKKWHDFEVAHGNEQTFLDMLRIKRSVTALYSHVNYMAGETSAAPSIAFKIGSNSSSKDAMSLLEAEGEAEEAKEVEGTDTLETGLKRKANRSDAMEDNLDSMERVTKKASSPHDLIPGTDEVNEENPEEIDLDDMEEDNPEAIDLEERAIPSSLFGSVLDSSRQIDDDASSKVTKMGALERLKNRQ